MTAALSSSWTTLLRFQPGWAELAAGLATGLGLALWSIVRFWPGEPSWDSWIRRRSARRKVVTTDTSHSSGEGRWRRLWLRTLARVGLLTPTLLRQPLQAQLQRSGLQTAPEQVAAAGALLTTAVGSVAAALAALGILPTSVAVLATCAVPLGLGARIVEQGRRRQRAVSGQLPILVDLMSLEQSGGGIGARAALERVLARVEGEAAAVLRGCLTRSAAAGTAPLDRQMEEEAVRMQVPALAALAAVLRLQRDEGVSTGALLGHLARGLRDRQRDQLLAQGRRALVTMLLPVALCILLPFVLIILYPALERLATALS